MVSTASTVRSPVSSAFRAVASGPSKDWGSSSYGHIGNGIDFSFEELSEGGAELAVEGGASDLEQEIGAAAGPSHLLRFVHAAVDQEVGGAFGDRRADPQTGAMALGVVDQPETMGSRRRGYKTIVVS
jgi:hypothetical protein